MNFKGKFKGKEKSNLEPLIPDGKEYEKEFEELEDIISELKRKPSFSIDEKVFEKTKYMVYKALKEKTISQEKVSPLIVPLLLLSFITFILFNFLFYNILLRIFGDSAPFIFISSMIYQFSGVLFFFTFLINKIRGGLENGKRFC